MPTARDALLDAARTAVGAQPWAGVRMVDVAAAAGVSRQTLYNEFGSKRGLGSALVGRELHVFLAGAERALAEAVAGSRTDAGEALATAADWTLRAAEHNPLIRAAVTGEGSERLPGPVVCPAELLRALCERAVRVLKGAGAGGVGLEWACEAVARLTLSYLIVPGATRESTRRGILTVGRAAAGAASP